MISFSDFTSYRSVFEKNECFCFISKILTTFLPKFQIKILQFSSIYVQKMRNGQNIKKDAMFSDLN